MKEGEEAARERVCMTQGPRQQHGDRLGEGVGLGGGGQRERERTQGPIHRWVEKESVSACSGVLFGDQGQDTWVGLEDIQSVGRCQTSLVKSKGGLTVLETRSYFRPTPLSFWCSVWPCSKAFLAGGEKGTNNYQKGLQEIISPHSGFVKANGYAYALLLSE